ncbi:hypothetical protein D3C86_1126290 [compost metagenome]
MPATALHFQRVDGILHQDGFACATSRGLVVEFGLEEQIRLFRRFHTLGIVQRVFQIGITRRGQNCPPGTVDVPGVIFDIGGITLITQQVVPHGLIAIFRDRERNARQRVFQCDSAFECFGADGVFCGVIQQPLRQRNAAMGRKHIDPERRVTLEQFLRGRGQFVGVLTDVFAIDDNAWLVGLIRVRTERTTRLKTRRRLGETAGVGRNGVVGITGLFSADACQAVAESGRFIGGDGCVCRTSDGNGQCGEQKRVDEFHGVTPAIKQRLRSNGRFEGKSDHAPILELRLSTAESSGLPRYAVVLAIGPWCGALALCTCTTG